MATVAAPSASPFASLSAGAASAPTANEAGSADRFLKLLVTQMQNQDPLNPMDNAQVTSQMAQINTVSGLDKLNTTVQSLNGRFLQMQVLAGASLVGHDVTVPGNRLDIDAGVGRGGFELAATAGRVTVEVLNPAGLVVDRLSLGAQPAGRHGFEWTAKDAADGADYRFRIVAVSGTQAVAAKPLMRDRVESVSALGDGLAVDTRHSGRIGYGDVVAFN